MSSNKFKLTNLLPEQNLYYLMTQSIIKKWLKDFVLEHTKTAKEIFNDYKCDHCGILIGDLSEVWSGVAIGLSEYMVCGDCYHHKKPHLIEGNICVHKYWKMFKDTEHKCTKLDIMEGWYRDIKLNEDLCLYHGNLLMQSEAPEQDCWKQGFTKIDYSNLIRINISNEIKYYLNEAGRGGCFQIKPCELTLPAMISDEQYLAVATQWFNCTNNQPLDPCGWSDLTQCNGRDCSLYGDNFIFYDAKIDNICEWVPFDSFKDGTLALDGGYALVNCNSESTQYLQVITVVFDDHGRSSVDHCDLNIEQYLANSKVYLDTPIDENIAIHHNIYCDNCDPNHDCQNMLRGIRTICCENSKFNTYDLCKQCFDSGHRCDRYTDSHILTVKPSTKLHYIEKIRTELKQGFHFG